MSTIGKDYGFKRLENTQPKSRVESQPSAPAEKSHSTNAPSEGPSVLFPRSGWESDKERETHVGNSLNHMENKWGGAGDAGGSSWRTQPRDGGGSGVMQPMYGVGLRSGTDPLGGGGDGGGGTIQPMYGVGLRGGTDPLGGGGDGGGTIQPMYGVALRGGTDPLGGGGGGTIQPMYGVGLRGLGDGGTGGTTGGVSEPPMGAMYGVAYRPPTF